MKESEKIETYLDLARELEKLGNRMVTVIPITVDVLGTVSKDLEKRPWELEVSGRIEHC